MTWVATNANIIMLANENLMNTIERVASGYASRMGTAKTGIKPHTMFERTIIAIRKRCCFRLLTSKVVIPFFGFKMGEMHITRLDG